jgi:sec-independent protein translocase protein TatC
MFIPCAIFSNEIFTFVAQPLIDKLPKGGQLVATSVISPFMTPFKLSLFVALLLAIPYVLWQVWAFVAPGLYKHEKRFAIPLVLSSIVLFYAGAAFAYSFVFPVMFDFFAKTTPVGVTMMTDISNYLDFVLTMIFAFGVAFEVPIAVVLLVISGVVSLEKLRGARGYVLIGIFVIAAFLTPPDAISQSIMAIPMYLLYEGGLIMARILLRMRRQMPQTED